MNAPQSFLPYGRQTIEDDDLAAVADVLRGDFLTTGPAVAAFEDAFSAQTGASHAVAVSSGTAALHLATLALGLGPGDTVAVPTITFVATANAARLAGAEVVFTDIDPETGLMGADDLMNARERTPDGIVNAVYPVHLNGQPCDMEAVRAAAGDAAIIEDACHALGGTVHGRNVGDGHYSDITMFSLHPVKAVAMGEGGVLTSNDAGLAVRLRELRSHGLVTDPSRFRNEDAAFDASGAANPWYYELHEPGLNYRASDIHCALGRSQLTKLRRFIDRRRTLAERYDVALADCAPALRPMQRVAWGESGWHLYPVLIAFDEIGLDRAALMTNLRARGIGTQVHYIPVHRQPYYAERYGTVELPGAERYYARCLSLPMFPAMELSDVDRVAGALRELLPA
jgi:UDP-4-amino-4,6-dideoxy-N-acetyl-beta-L-altrosamine transaminase